MNDFIKKIPRYDEVFFAVFFAAILSIKATIFLLKIKQSAAKTALMDPSAIPNQ